MTSPGWQQPPRPDGSPADGAAPETPAGFAPPPWAAQAAGATPPVPASAPTSAGPAAPGPQWQAPPAANVASVSDGAAADANGDGSITDEEFRSWQARIGHTPKRIPPPAQQVGRFGSAPLPSAPTGRGRTRVRWFHAVLLACGATMLVLAWMSAAQGHPLPVQSIMGVALVAIAIQRLRGPRS